MGNSSQSIARSCQRFGTMKLVGFIKQKGSIQIPVLLASVLVIMMVVNTLPALSVTKDYQGMIKTLTGMGYTVSGGGGAGMDLSGSQNGQILQDSSGVYSGTNLGASIIVAASDASPAQKAAALASGGSVVTGNADDEIQAAINALPISGGQVELTSGNYAIGTTITRAINNVKIIGSGGSTILNTTTENVILISGDYWQISGIKFVGNNSEIHNTALSIQGDYNQIENNTFTELGWGVYIYMGNHNSIIGNTVIANLQSGIVIEANGGTMSDNNISENQIINNGGMGVHIEGSGVAYPLHTNISANTIIGNHSAGVYLASARYSNVCMNNIYDNYTFGIEVVSSHFNTIGENNLLNNDVGAVAGSDYGIALDASNENVITSNYIGGSQGSYGIVERNASDCNIITSNNLHDNAAAIATVGTGTIVANNIS